MYKNLAFVGLLNLFFATAVAQQVRLPLGIPDLSVKKLEIAAPQTILSLEIPGNQTIAGFTHCNCQSGCVVLPVNMLSFRGRRQSTSLVQLNWKTSNETQNKGFEVERSLGNTADFAMVAFVPAKLPGGYVNEYELPDNNDYMGISYYRLKQVDIDGNYTYSETVAVKGYGTSNSISLYPNPVQEKLTADIFSTGNTTALLLLTDATQKLMYTVNIRLGKGINIIDIPVAKLGGGLYFVRVITESKIVLPAKFVKL